MAVEIEAHIVKLSVRKLLLFTLSKHNVLCIIPLSKHNHTNVSSVSVHDTVGNLN